MNTDYSPEPADLVKYTKYPFPECKCDYQVDKNGVGVLSCKGKFKIRKKRSDVTNRVEFHPPRQPLAFRIETSNPRKQADEIDWFWIVQHTTGTDMYGTNVLSEGMEECWKVQAQMENLVVLLEGPSQAGAECGFLALRSYGPRFRIPRCSTAK